MDPLSITASVAAISQVVLVAVNGIKEHERNKRLAKSLTKKTKEAADRIRLIAEMIDKEIREVLEMGGTADETKYWIELVTSILKTLQDDLQEMEQAIQYPRSIFDRPNWSKNLEGAVTRIQGSITYQMTLLCWSENCHPRRRLTHVDIARISQNVSSETQGESADCDSPEIPPNASPGGPSRMNSISSAGSQTTLAGPFEGTIDSRIQGHRGSIDQESSIPSEDLLLHLPLIEAVQVRDKRRVAELLMAGADVKAFDQYGMSAIHYCAEKGSATILDIIGRKHPDTIKDIVNHLDYFNRRSALHIAAIHNQHKFGKRALELGAEIGAFDGYNDTAYTLAVKHNKFDFQTMLRNQVGA